MLDDEETITCAEDVLILEEIVPANDLTMAAASTNSHRDRIGSLPQSHYPLLRDCSAFRDSFNVVSSSFNRKLHEVCSSVEREHRTDLCDMLIACVATCVCCLKQGTRG